MTPERRAYNRAYYLKNRKTLLDKRAAYAAANPDKIAALNSRYYAEKRAEIRVQQSEYYQQNILERQAFNKSWRIENRERVAAYKAAKADKIAAQKADWYSRNGDKSRARNSEWYKNNRDKANAKGARRRAIEKKACPPWADLNAIEDIYLLAGSLERQTGIKHHVDHIVPLKNKLVCGLHIAINLRPIPAVDNAKKKNKLIQELAIWPSSQQQI